jgi:hypothetical protein
VGTVKRGGWCQCVVARTLWEITYLQLYEGGYHVRRRRLDVTRRIRYGPRSRLEARG